MEEIPYPIKLNVDIHSEGHKVMRVSMSDGTEIVEYIPITPATYKLTYDQIYDLMIRVYKNGYSTHEMVEAGLESYDPDSTIRWMLLDLDKLTN